ncbi:MAG: hypothetical protein DI586_02645 [Micavibrio aeruginosavorus]|uniref:RNA polymerase subunit sigma n=1 Tax=Micavibrio aeruginosavorus TaxID=349221 RepID=A0A2W5FQP7_9BACT|nr:MAG: hypothetical protein DI586_02645 [Micavibrio aeruginosavorus]
MGQSDEGLMGLFQSGDALAFHYLIERHKGLIRLQVRKYFGRSADMDDILQDVCLSLWQNRMSWKPGLAKFSTWLFRVTANRCIDILRQKKEITTDSNFDHINSGIMSAEDRIYESQTSNQLMKLLAELPVQQQLALKLFYYEEADINQICQKMSLSDQAVRSLLKRGKQKLRAVIEPAAIQSALG